MKLKKQTAIAIGVVLLLFASVGLVAAMIIPSAEDLLTSSIETLEGITTGYGQVTVSAQMSDQDFSGTFEGWIKRDAGPNGEPAVRVVVLEADQSALIGQTLVSDGSQFWFHDPQRNTVIVGQAEEITSLLMERLEQYEGHWPYEQEFDPETAEVPETPAEVVARILEYFTVERSGSRDIGEYEVDALRLVPIAEMMPEEIRMAGGYVNLWLRSGDQLPLAVEYAEGSMGAFTIEASEVVVNEPIADSIFSFAIPEGSEVIDVVDLANEIEAHKQTVDAAEVGALMPDQLPAGAEPAGTEQFGTTIVQRFSLPGDLSFVIAQGPSVPQDAPAEATSSETVTVRGAQGILHTNDEATRSLLIWQESDEFVLIGGDLSPDQALAIAESLQ